MIGYAFCGSFCTHSHALDVLRALKKDGEELLPIFSESVYKTDTRFGKAKDLCQAAEDICKNRGIYTIAQAEPLGPSRPLDYLIICPCTSNTLAKLALGICDTPVTMAAKAHLRRDGKILICLASNDAMGAGMKNLAALAVRKNYYFAPMRQDDIVKKPYSLVCDFSQVREAYRLMKEGKQLRPLFL